MRNVKKSAVIINSVFFLFLSLFYLQIIESLERGTSAFNMLGLLFFFKKNMHLFLLGGGVFLSVITLRKWGPTFYALFCSLVIYRTFTIFFTDFDKIILILNFFYIVLSYNFYLFLKLELEEPYYNPCYPANILPCYESKLLPIRIKKSGVEYLAYLTNWGPRGLFCRLDQGGRLQGRVEIEASIRGHSFSWEGDIVTFRPSLFGSGIGIRIVKNSFHLEMGWKDFYDIISELGHSSL